MSKVKSMGSADKLRGRMKMQIVKSMRSADKLKEGDLITIDVNFFPHENNDDDDIEFWSEYLVVLSVTDDYIKVCDEYGQITRIPIEDYKVCDSTVIKHIKSPAKGAAFYIWVVHNNLADSIIAEMQL